MRKWIKYKGAEIVGKIHKKIKWHEHNSFYIPE